MKKILYSLPAKIITFALLFASFTGIFAVGVKMADLNLDWITVNSLSNPDFKQTNEYQHQLSNAYSKLYVMTQHYISNTDSSGNPALSEREAEIFRNIGLFNQNNELQEISDHFVYYISDGLHALSNLSLSSVAKDYFEKNYDTWYFRIRDQYYSSAGDSTLNLGDPYAELFNETSEADPDVTIYLAPKNEYVAENQQKIQADVSQMKDILLQLSWLSFIALLLIVLQIIQTGKVIHTKSTGSIASTALSDSTGSDGSPDSFFLQVLSDEKNLSGGGTGRIPGEFAILLIIIFSYFGGLLLFGFNEFKDFIGVFSSDNRVFQLLFSLLMASLASAIFLCFLYLVRRLKQRNLFRTSLIYRICRVFGRLVKKIWRNFILMDVYKNYPISKMFFLRQIAFFALIALISLLILFFLGIQAVFPALMNILLLFTLLFLYIYQNNKDFKDLAVLCEHIGELYNGNTGFHSQVPKESLVAASVMQLNNISLGVQKTVDVKIQAERMKIDLVTNVSHDLKTPLTSIISYIDLLSREELTTEAADYVKILEKKSDRLKKIVSDLFDLAKSTSGSDELELEKLDCAVLLKQVMADMEDAITSSGRTIRCEYGSDPAPVYADGKKMYRIFQNILDNALKYSMDGTRIFLEMKVSGSKVVTSIKNTANYEMDFDTEEILGRFTRGEKSRTGEGNGLGLSIAKSFADACGGDLAVAIDGDQFNVTLTFPVTKS